MPSRWSGSHQASGVFALHHMQVPVNALSASQLSLFFEPVTCAVYRWRLHFGASLALFLASSRYKIGSLDSPHLFSFQLLSLHMFV